MKHFISICVLIISSISSLSLSAKTNADASVFLKNGSSYENIIITLPEWTDENVTLIVNGNKQKIESDSISYILFWHKDNPDHKAKISFFPKAEYSIKENIIKPMKNSYGWFVYESEGRYLTYLVKFQKVKKISSDEIKYEVSDYRHYFVKDGCEYAIEVPLMPTNAKTRDWLKLFLSDDPELTERITEKGYFNNKESLRQGNFCNPFLYEEIAVDYNPHK